MVYLRYPAKASTFSHRSNPDKRISFTVVSITALE